LAWAITIHKSQGLTFQRAIIDAGESFAAGQVYVALSRCTSLDGVVLLSRLNPVGISTNDHVVGYLKNRVSAEELQRIVQMEKKKYLGNQLLKAFELRKVTNTLGYFKELAPTKKLPDIQAVITLTEDLYRKAMELNTVAEKFQPLLSQLLQQTEATNQPEALITKTQNAIGYFCKNIYDDILTRLRRHIADMQTQKKVKAYLNELIGIEKIIWGYVHKLLRLDYDGVILSGGADNYTQYVPLHQKPTETIRKEKQEAGSSFKATLIMFKDNKTVAEIAAARGFTVGTIETHLFQLVKTGDLNLSEIIPPQKMAAIKKAIEEVGIETGSTPIKQALGDDYSYAEIRAVIFDIQQQKPATAQ
jgi:hypothetical protein